MWKQWTYHRLGVRQITLIVGHGVECECGSNTFDGPCNGDCQFSPVVNRVYRKHILGSFMLRSLGATMEEAAAKALKLFMNFILDLWTD